MRWPLEVPGPSSRSMDRSCRVVTVERGTDLRDGDGEGRALPVRQEVGQDVTGAPQATPSIQPPSRGHSRPAGCRATIKMRRRELG
jgi:hypothetical protein